jgi:hypothetical protein
MKQPYPSTPMPSQLNIPQDYICPITLRVMIHPLITRQGKNYEKSAILNWLNENGVCPITRKSLRPSDLTHNRGLEAKIVIWRQDNGVPEPTEEEADASQDDHWSLSVHSILTMWSTHQSSKENNVPVPTLSENIESPHLQPREGCRTLLSQILASAVDDFDEELDL